MEDFKIFHLCRSSLYLNVTSHFKSLSELFNSIFLFLYYFFTIYTTAFKLLSLLDCLFFKNNKNLFPGQLLHSSSMRRQKLIILIPISIGRRTSEPSFKQNNFLDILARDAKNTDWLGNCSAMGGGKLASEKALMPRPI